jgi:hypothetical protein
MVWLTAGNAVKICFCRDPDVVRDRQRQCFQAADDNRPVRLHSGLEGLLVAAARRLG